VPVVSDYINVISEDPNSDETFFNSQEDYESALIEQDYNLPHLNVMIVILRPDNTLVGGESATDVIGLQQIDDMIHTPE
jgi:hypothetical protein